MKGFNYLDLFADLESSLATELSGRSAAAIGAALKEKICFKHPHQGQYGDY